MSEPIVWLSNWTRSPKAPPCERQALPPEDHRICELVDGRVRRHIEPIADEE